MAFPPPKPPLRPGTARPLRPEREEDAIARARREKDELLGACEENEEELEELKVRYEKYFLGVERKAPHREREELKKKVMRLKGAFTRNAGLKFRVQSLHARFLSYERMWERSVREKEEGTYHRDLFKARLHRREHEEPAPSEPAKAPDAAPEPPPPAEARGPAAARPAAKAPIKGGTQPAAAPAAASAKQPATPARAPAQPGQVEDPQMRALYDSYIAAKKRCKEDVSKLSYDAVAKSVSKQIPGLIKRYGAKSVEFKVEVKDGRAVLKAIPKV